jgi:HEAT repeat protein
MIRPLSPSRKAWFIAGFIVVLFLGMLWLPRLLRTEPAYHGKSLTLWLQTYAPSSRSGRGSPAWTEADDAVRHIGTNGIPVLLRMLRATDSRLELQLVALAKKQHIIKIHFTLAATLNVEASRAFLALGDTAKDAVPALMKIYDEKNPILSQGAELEALGWIGPAAEPAIPLLLQAATNSNSKIRANTFWALGEIHAQPQLCVPELIHALNDSNDWVLVSAAHALGAFGVEAQSATPLLTGLASTTFPSGKFSANRIQVRIEARNALRKINRDIVSPSSETLPDFGIPTAEISAP